jgi:hypothetical protein
MNAPESTLDRFRHVAMLKNDHFSTVTRGFWRTESGEVPAVLRRLDNVPWWTKGLALFLARNERVALLHLDDAEVGPVVLASGKDFIVRSWIDALPLNLADVKGDERYFKNAKRLLRRMRRAGIAHNDLAKRQNWLRTDSGEARVTDFQLAAVSRKRGKLFRIAAREDLRHLLKHKRFYCREALTPSEKRMLERRSLPTRVWRTTVKPVYNFVTRKILKYMDREGGGVDATVVAPQIAKRLSEHPQVKSAAVLPYPTPRGALLYAFVETDKALGKDVMQAHLRDAALPMPSLMQFTERLPRKSDGELYEDVLRVIAQNHLNLLDRFALDSINQNIVARIAEGRLNHTDKHWDSMRPEVPAGAP